MQRNSPRLTNVKYLITALGFDELLADKGPTRDYFNIWTVQGAVTE